ncbi:MAG: hypothetical protein J6A55_05990 [Oscillospiraceae bacterium]|nr:hypothetical protein [Oscillospiraceae bacterium]
MDLVIEIVGEIMEALFEVIFDNAFDRRKSRVTRICCCSLVVMLFVAIVAFLAYGAVLAFRHSVLGGIAVLAIIAFITGLFVYGVKKKKRIS